MTCAKCSVFFNYKFKIYFKVEEPAKPKTTEVCSDLSQDGKITEEEPTDNLMGMICTAEEGSGAESCQPANIQCYKTDLSNYYFFFMT